MTKKKVTKNDDKNTLRLTGEPERDPDATLAQAFLTPSLQAATTTQRFTDYAGDKPSIGAIVSELRSQIKTAQDGELGRSEAMLVAQAHSLDAIFNHLARRSINAELMDHFDRFLKLALRAQSQCRSTIEALSEMKNPQHIAFVKQANIAQNQQVNNGSRAEENKTKQNELLEKADGERLDFGTTGAAGNANPAMATVEEIDRADNSSR